MIVETSLSEEAVFRALDSRQRRRILAILGERTPDAGKTCCAPEEVCACKLTERLGLAPSTISHHMSLLEEAGLIECRREGRWAYYTLRRDVLRRVADGLSGL